MGVAAPIICKKEERRKQRLREKGKRTNSSKEGKIITSRLLTKMTTMQFTNGSKLKSF